MDNVFEWPDSNTVVSEVAVFLRALTGDTYSISVNLSAIFYTVDTPTSGSGHIVTAIYAVGKRLVI